MCDVIENKEGLCPYCARPLGQPPNDRTAELEYIIKGLEMLIDKEILDKFYEGINEDKQTHLESIKMGQQGI